MRKYLRICSFFTLILLICSCGVVNEVLQLEKPDNSPSLGSLVVGKTFKKTPEIKGIIESSKGLRVKVQERIFTNKTFKKYKMVNGANRIAVNYVDSISIKPSYVTVQLIDDITYIDLLKQDVNNSLYAFAKANSKTRIVTEVSMIFKEKKLDLDRTYFLELKESGNQLVGYKEGHSKLVFEMSKAFVFDHELSYGAWGKDNTERIQLVDLVEEGTSCPSSLVRNPNKLKKEISLFKY